MSHRKSPGPPPKKQSAPKSSSNNQQTQYQPNNRPGPSRPSGGLVYNSTRINGRAVAQYVPVTSPPPVIPSSSRNPPGFVAVMDKSGRKSPLLSTLASKASTSRAINSKDEKSVDENNAAVDDLGEEDPETTTLSTPDPDQLLGSTDSEDDDSTTSISCLPDNVLENLFTFLELSEVIAVSAVCATWHRVISDQNGDVWRSLCLRKMDRETLTSELLAICPTFKTKLRAYYHAWNALDCSRNIFVKPNGFTIHRNPVAQSTDGARGKIGFSRGRHAWEVKWEGPLGTVAVVGVATHDADLRTQGYIALLGKDERSWGWNLVENVLLHNGDSQGNYPLVNNAPRYQVGEKIRVILDCEDNTLSFEKNEEFLGVGFRGLPQHEPLYPAVSAVYGNSEISMVYLGPPLDG